MKRFKMLSVFLCMAVGMLGFAPASGAVDITLGASKEKVAPGSTVEIQVKADAKDLCGAALTVEYDTTKVDLVTKTGGAIAAGEVDPAEVNSDIFTTVTDSRNPPGTPATAVPMAGKNTATGTATVSLSGAYVDPLLGAGRFTVSGEKKLFGITFKVKDTVAKGETVAFSVKQTSLLNPAAGWGTEGGTPVPVPPLVGVPADWKTKTDVKDQFFDILATFPATALSVEVGDEIPAYKSGDGDGSGVIDSTDALYVLHVVAGNFSANQLLGNCDVNCDGVTDSTDALYILHHVAGNVDISNVVCK